MLLDWHKDLLFASSVRAGCVDLDGCGVVDVLPRWVCLLLMTIAPSMPSCHCPSCHPRASLYRFRQNFLGSCSADLLPSVFIPTCSRCSTPAPAPGLVSSVGDVCNAVCRECHQKMSTAFCFQFSLFTQVSLPFCYHLGCTTAPQLWEIFITFLHDIPTP